MIAIPARKDFFELGSIFIPVGSTIYIGRFYDEIAEILKQEGNNHCIDCQAENPTYISINNAVFLCQNCADIHKRLGQDISKIKSILKDEFNEEEISLIKLGGNARLENLLKEYSLSENQGKQYKYCLTY